MGGQGAIGRSLVDGGVDPIDRGEPLNDPARVGSDVRHA
jgi:hypothetical protein